MKEREKAIFRLLDTNGNGTGTTEATGDYSSTPTSFRISNSTGIADIERMIIFIEDTGTFDSGDYGNAITLTNGIRVYLRDNADQVIEEYTSFPILTNGDWAGHCHDLNLHTFGSGNQVMTLRWTFAKSGQRVSVDLKEGEYFEVLLNDDFTGLVKHRFTIQGKRRTEEV